MLSDSVIITNKDILPIKGFRYIHLFQLKSYQLLQNTHRLINLEAHLSYQKLPQNWTYDWQLYLVSRIWILVLCFLFQILITYKQNQSYVSHFNISMRFVQQKKWKWNNFWGKISQCVFEVWTNTWDHPRAMTIDSTSSPIMTNNFYSLSEVVNISWFQFSIFCPSRALFTYRKENVSILCMNNIAFLLKVR